MPQVGDYVTCFMPLNCTDVREQCVVGLRHGKDVLWRCGSAAWGKKPKKIPLRKLLKEVEGRSRGTMTMADASSSRQLLHRASRFLGVETLEGENTKTFHCKLDHPLETTHDKTSIPIVLSVYRFYAEGQGDAQADSAGVYKLEVYNSANNTRSWVLLPKQYDGDSDIMDEIYCSPGGETLYIIDEPQDDGSAGDGRIDVEVRRFTTTEDNVTYTTNLRVLIPPKAFDLHEDELREWLQRFEGKPIDNIKEARSPMKRKHVRGTVGTAVSKTLCSLQPYQGEQSGSHKENTVGPHLLDPTMESVLVHWVTQNARLDSNMKLTFG